MRDDYAKYQQRGAQIVVVGRHVAEAVDRYWRENKIPYIGIPDPEAKTAGLYQQKWKILKLGLMPALFVIDRRGKVAYAYYSDGMSDIPKDDVVLNEIDKLGK